MIKKDVLPYVRKKVFIVIWYMSKSQQKKLVAPVKDLTEDSLTKGLFTKELLKDGAASNDKQQWEESPWSNSKKRSHYHSWAWGGRSVSLTELRLWEGVLWIRAGPQEEECGSC